MSLDVEYEADLLGAAAWAKPRDVDEALMIVTPDDFQTGRHRTVWECFATCRHEGLPIEAGVVVDRLETTGMLDAAGGVAQVAGLFSRSLHGSTLLFHARRINERARRRRAVKACSQMLARLNDPQTELATVIHEGVEELLTTTREGSADGLLRASDFTDALTDLRDTGPTAGFRCGWPSLDALFRPEPKQLTVVTGVPSHGKSTWLDAYLIRMVSAHKWRVAFFSPERVTAKHQARILATSAGKPFDGGHFDDDTLTRGIAWLDQHFVWIDDTAKASVGGILAAARLANDRYPLDALVIDPWNWVEVNKPSDMKLTEYIGVALNEITRFAQRSDLHAFVVAHPTKLRQHEGGAKEGQYYVPRPYDIAESSNWFNKPWWCISVWRDHLMPSVGQVGYDPERDPQIVDIHVQKARDDDLGRVGVASLRFDPVTRRYSELEAVPV